MTEIEKKALQIVNGGRFENKCSYCKYGFIAGFDCSKEDVSCYEGVKLYLESKEETNKKDDIE